MRSTASGSPGRWSGRRSGRQAAAGDSGGHFTAVQVENRAVVHPRLQQQRGFAQVAVGKGVRKWEVVRTGDSRLSGGTWVWSRAAGWVEARRVGPPTVIRPPELERVQSDTNPWSSVKSGLKVLKPSK